MTLEQLEASLWITSFDNQLVISLLTTWNKLVVNKLSQAVRTHPDIGLLITTLLQDVNRLVATFAFLAVYIKNLNTESDIIIVQIIRMLAAKAKEQEDKILQ